MPDLVDSTKHPADPSIDPPAMRWTHCRECGHPVPVGEECRCAHDGIVRPGTGTGPNR